MPSHKHVIRPAAQQLERRTLLAAVSLVFSEGSGGYAGAQDTHVQLATPGASFGGSGTILVDLDEDGDAGNQPSQGLIRFGNLFGSGPGQLPPGASITSATLTLRTGTATGDSSSTATSLHRMLAGWDESSTWDSLAGGVTADGVEAAATADGTVSPSVAGGAVTVDVRPTVQSWSGNPASNLGWALLPGGSNGWGVLSSETADPAARPQLSVTYESAESTVNQPPSVSAGPDQAVTLPSSAALDGTVTDDGLPNPPGTVTTSWSTISGPGTVTFADPAAVDTTAEFSAAGTYALRLTASDGEFTRTDDVTITVNPSSSTNQPPSVSAGPDQTVTLPSSATLDGAVSDDGLPNPPAAVTTSWSSVSGPGTVTFGNTSAVDTTASFSAAGTYVLRLAASDGEYSRSDDVTVVVSPESQTNDPPSVSAGPDQTALSSRTNLDGTVTDDGLPNPPGAVTTRWTKVSGPGSAKFANASAVDTTVRFSATGSYVLRLSASDGTLSAHDDVTVTFVTEPASDNTPPAVSAGPDQEVTLPSSAALDGTVTDDGLPNPPGAVSVNWSRISGSGTVTFADPAAVDTTASFSAAGTYVLRLAASDGEFTRTDEVTLTVQSAPTTPTIQSLNPVESTQNTGEKPQSKVWKYADTWWSVFPDSTGTWVRRLDDTTWNPVFQISTRTTGKADVFPAADGVAHVLLYDGSASTRLASLQYVPGSPGTYEFWSQRTSLPTVTLGSGVEIATLAVDGAGRMWVASDTGSTIEVRYSDANYSTWSDPNTLASGIGTDDLCDITTLPDGSVGVIWSNQNSELFGFRTHAAGASPTNWSSAESPASQSALSVGAGFSDDHMSLAVTSDGTVYAAVKTSYDSSGYPVIGLLVRRPTGVWDNFYSVDTDLGATRPIVVVNESQGNVMVVYRSGAHNIIYRQAPLSNPGSFAPRQTLMSGGVNNVSSTRQALTNDGVFLASTYPAPSGGEVVRSVRLVWSTTSGSTFSLTSTSPALFSSGPAIEEEEDLATELLA